MNWGRSAELQRELDALRKRVRQLEERLQYVEDTGPPAGLNCDHRGNIIVKPEDEVFEERRGCLLCNHWLSPVRLKRR